jgi:hypothetical protein
MNVNGETELLINSHWSSVKSILIGFNVKSYSFH